MVVETIAQADQVEMDWIAANVDIETALAAYEPQPRPNSQTRAEFVMPPLGTWRLDPYGEIQVLVEIPVEDCPPQRRRMGLSPTLP